MSVHMKIKRDKKLSLTEIIYSVKNIKFQNYRNGITHFKMKQPRVKKHVFFLKTRLFKIKHVFSK